MPAVTGYVVAGLIALIAACYLVVALVNPERF